MSRAVTMHTQDFIAEAGWKGGPRAGPHPSSLSVELDSKRWLREHHMRHTPPPSPPRARRLPELGRSRSQGECEWRGREKCLPTEGTP